MKATGMTVIGGRLVSIAASAPRYQRVYQRVYLNPTWPWMIISPRSAFLLQ